MSKKKPAAYLCQKCQHPTSRLMQAASPFYTCPVEACAFYIRIGCAPSKGVEAASGDSVGKVELVREAIGFAPYDLRDNARLAFHELETQHREEVASWDVRLSEQCRNTIEQTARAVAAEAALGEAQDEIRLAVLALAHASERHNTYSRAYERASAYLTRTSEARDDG